MRTPPPPPCTDTPRRLRTLQIQSDGPDSPHVEWLSAGCPPRRPAPPQAHHLAALSACSPRSWTSHPNCSRYSRLRCCDTLGGRGLGTGMLGQQLLFSITVPREGRAQAGHSGSSPARAAPPGAPGTAPLGSTQLRHGAVSPMSKERSSSPGTGRENAVRQNVRRFSNLHCLPVAPMEGWPRRKGAGLGLVEGTGPQPRGAYRSGAGRTSGAGSQF